MDHRESRKSYDRECIESLANGFQALSLEYEDLSQKYQGLEKKLNQTVKQVWLVLYIPMRICMMRTPLALDLELLGGVEGMNSSL